MEEKEAVTELIVWIQKSYRINKKSKNFQKKTTKCQQIAHLKKQHHQIPEANWERILQMDPWKPAQPK